MAGEMSARILADVDGYEQLQCVEDEPGSSCRHRYPHTGDGMYGLGGCLSGPPQVRSQRGPTALAHTQFRDVGNEYCRWSGEQSGRNSHDEASTEFTP